MADVSAQAPARPDAVLQKRGVERVQAILDAGDKILGAEGYDAATLKAIGERAGIPLASIYHYFADRHQVDHAILSRHLDAMDVLIKAALDDDAIETLADAIDAVIDAMLTYFRSNPSCRTLWFTDQRDESITALVREFDDGGAELLRQVATEKGLLREETPPHIVEFAFEAGSRLFDVAFRRSPDGDDTAIDEARKMAVAYLSLYAP